MASASYASPNSIMAFYQNTTGSTVTTITVSFAVEKYRTNTSSFSLNFYSSADGNSWTPRSGGDIASTVFAPGASTFHFSIPQAVTRTVTISGLSIPNNGNFYLRWLFQDDNTATAQGTGLDNVSVFAGTPTPFITAKLRDFLSIDNPLINQANPGDQLTYTTVIKNTGTGDANNVVLTEPAPGNTTLVPGSVKTSALARDDNFTTPLNTALTGANVLSNDYGIPSPTVISFGPSSNASAISAGSAGNSDNGGTVTVNTNGTFTYTPATGFNGIDRFSYIATTGTSPDNNATVTITVGTAATATAESYNVTGNISITHGAGAGILFNDAGSSIVLTAINGNTAGVGVPVTTTQGGNLTVQTNGGFTYNPPAGYEGADNFTYTINNGFGVPSTATVTLNISGMIWFINNTAGTGDGRLSSPFNSLATFTAINNAMGNNPAIGDNIFIYSGAGNYTGGTTLLNNQRLIGQGASTTLPAITGIILATGSAALPALGGSPAIIINAGGNGIMVAQGNTIRGLTVGNSSGSAILGSGFGALTVSETTVNTTGQAISLTTGALAATFTSLQSGGGINGILLSGATGSLTIGAGGTISGATGASISIVGGTLSLLFNGDIGQNNNAAMVNISGHNTGTITFQTGSLAATNGMGLQFDNADGTYNFNGTTALNGGDAGIDILNGSGGTFMFTTGHISGSSGDAFTVGGTANTATITCNLSISKTSAGAAVNILNHSTNTITFGVVFVNNGTGLQFDNADGIYNFNGTTTLNGGDAGIDILNGSAGTFTFGTGVAITNPSGNAFTIGGTASTATVTYSGSITKSNTGAAVSITNHATNTVTFQTGTINATNGTGLQFDNADGIYNFSGTVTLNGGDAGIDIINGSSGNFTFSNAPITNPGGVAFFVSGGNGPISHTGTISKSSSGRLIDIQSRTGGSVTITGNLSSTGSATGINVSSCTGGTITFSGSAKTFTTPAITGITLANNTGSIINFTGGALVITSTTATGFTATGGGTISVQGAGNIITATTGTALNVASTSIGASGLTFQSISHNGGVNGISLNTTGTGGGLTVTGTGSANSGGTVQNCTQTGILLNATAAISLSYMSISSNQDDGINGTTVAGFTLVNCTVNNNGNAAADEGVAFSNLSGNCSITNTTITGSYHNNFEVMNTTGTLSTLNFTGCTISSNHPTQGNHGILIDIQGAAELTSSTISSCTFTSNRVMGIQALGGTTGKINSLTVTGCTFTSHQIAIDFSGSGSPLMVLKFTGNTLMNQNSHAINVFQGIPSAGSIIQARIENNIIGNAAIAGSGSAIGNGVRINGNDNGSLIVLLNNNTIRQTPNGRGIEIIGRNGTGTMNVTVTNNNINPQDVSGFPLAAIFVQSNTVSTSGYTVRADVRGNTVPVGTAFDVGTGFISVVETSTSNLQLVNTTSSGTPTAHLAASNTGSVYANAGVSLIAGPILLPPL
jgi:hypothetical protein